jgi:hypothetical protein
MIDNLKVGVLEHPPGLEARQRELREPREPQNVDWLKLSSYPCIHRARLYKSLEQVPDRHGGGS